MRKRRNEDASQMKLKSLLIIIFSPAIIFWSFFGFYDIIVYGKNRTNDNFEEMVKELKEVVKNDMERSNTDTRYSRKKNIQ
jgi:hypothetical protein